MKHQRLLFVFLIVTVFSHATIVQSATIKNARGLFLDDFVRQCQTSADKKLCQCLGEKMYAEFSPIMRKISKETYRTWRSQKNLNYNQALTLAKEKLVNDAQYDREAELLIKKMPEIWSKQCLPNELAAE